MSESTFCPLCEVSLDLHDGPDSCDLAGERADLIELPYLLLIGRNVR